MTRITPEEVVEAYCATGFTPLQNEWYERFDGHGEACGLACVLAQRKPVTFHELVDEVELDSESVAEELELEFWYVEGFTMGFDGGSEQRVERRIKSSLDWCLPDHREKLLTTAKQGYEDGVAAWNAVRGEYFG